MATIPGALRLVRNARREETPPATSHYDQYEPAYRELLAEAKTLGGDEALSELSAWMALRIHETGHLPEPRAVRRRARAIVTRRGASIPADSTLQEPVEETDSAGTAESTTASTDGRSLDSSDGDSTDDLSTDALLDELESFEPYTADELADELEAPPGLIRSLLERLRDAGAVRRKTPQSNAPIWMRKPSATSCPDCEYRFEVKFLHPVLSPVKFCPQCGTQM